MHESDTLSPVSPAPQIQGRQCPAVLAQKRLFSTPRDCCHKHLSSSRPENVLETTWGGGTNEELQWSPGQHGRSTPWPAAARPASMSRTDSSLAALQTRPTSQGKTRSSRGAASTGPHCWGPLSLPSSSLAIISAPPRPSAPGQTPRHGRSSTATHFIALCFCGLHCPDPPPKRVGGQQMASAQSFQSLCGQHRRPLTPHPSQGSPHLTMSAGCGQDTWPAPDRAQC